MAKGTLKLKFLLELLNPCFRADRRADYVELQINGNFTEFST